MFYLAQKYRSGITLLLAGLLALMLHTPLLAQSQKAVEKLNVNKADVTALTYLPGVGPTRAARIINLRNTKEEGFTKLEELLEVSGIGKKTLESLRPYSTVIGGVAAPTEAMLTHQAAEAKKDDEADKADAEGESETATH